MTAVRRFVEERTGVDSGDLARAVHDATEGNPFFVEELVRLLAAERRLDQPVTGGLPVPASVREAINRHLAPLPEETLEVLRLASVLGKGVHVRGARARVGHPPDRLLGILDRAIAAG